MFCKYLFVFKYIKGDISLMCNIFTFSLERKNNVFF